MGLIIGRSSLTVEGLKVHRGVMDEAYRGETLLMARVEQGMSILAGDRIARLLLLRRVRFPARPTQGRGGFGSTGKKIFWEVLVNDKRPTFKLKVGEQMFEGLVDTGADVPMISQQRWPLSCPKMAVNESLTGLGRANRVYPSTEALRCIGPEGRQALVSFHIVRCRDRPVGPRPLTAIWSLPQYSHLISSGQKYHVRYGI